MILVWQYLTIVVGAYSMSVPHVFVPHSPFYTTHIALAVQNTREARRFTQPTDILVLPDILSPPGRHISKMQDPLEKSAICQALLAVAEVASRSGYQRLMICGDCGYYSLAAEAFTKSLSCWGTQSWVPHPDGAFASFRVPRFKSQSLDLDIILCLGTTQLISCPDPEKNLSCQLGRDTSVVYLTADARGWYSGEALKSVTAEYLPFERRPWNKKQWHFNLDDELG